MQTEETGSREALLKLRDLAVRHGPGRLYGDLKRALRDIDDILEAAAEDQAYKVRWLLAPTGNLQELSIEAGWAEEFLQVAEELEDEGTGA